MSKFFKHLLVVIITCIVNFILFYLNDYSHLKDELLILTSLVSVLISGIPLYFILKSKPFKDHYLLNIIATIISTFAYLIYNLYLYEEGGVLLIVFIYYFYIVIILFFLFTLILTFCQHITFFIIRVISLLLEKKEY